jgi:hypothetical protein
MVSYLGQIQERMKSARGLAHIHAIALNAGRAMLDENRDWLAVMKPLDVELPV